MTIKILTVLWCFVGASYAAIAPGQNAYLPPKDGYKYNKPSVPFPSPSQPPYVPPTPTRPPYRPPVSGQLPQRPSFQPTRPTPPPYRPPAPTQPPRRPQVDTGSVYLPPRPPPTALPSRPTPPPFRPGPLPSKPPQPFPPRPSPGSTYGPPTPPPYRPQLPSSPRPPVSFPTARPTPGLKPAPFDENEHLKHPHMPGTPFDFNYAVKDEQYGNDYSHNAINDGDQTKGEYRVQLPDGRVQVVKYTADWATGFHAQISYQGQPNYNQFRPGGSGVPGTSSRPNIPPAVYPTNRPSISSFPSSTSGSYPSGRPSGPSFPTPPISNKPAGTITNEISQQYAPSGGYKY